MTRKTTRKNSKPIVTEKYSYYDAAQRRSRLVESVKDIPLDVVAFPMYLGDNGVYYSVGDIYIYNGVTYIERNNEFAVEITPGDWHYFKTEKAAQHFIDNPVI